MDKLRVSQRVKFRNERVQKSFPELPINCTGVVNRCCAHNMYYIEWDNRISGSYVHGCLLMPISDSKYNSIW